MIAALMLFNNIFLILLKEIYSDFLITCLDGKRLFGIGHWYTK